MPSHVDLPPPPLPDLGRASLFFDFDGTLVDLAPTPDAVVVDVGLGGRLRALAAAAGGRVAIVTGRSIAQIDALMGDHAVGLAIAGSHGAEHRSADGAIRRPERSAALDDAVALLRTYADGEGLLFEGKTLGATLHFRHDPARGEAASAMAERVAAQHGLHANRGKMMVEVRLPGDKGAAVRTLMAAAMAGSVPWFFGDDLTDEDGFAAVAALGGAGVLIDPPRATAARYRLDDVAALRDWMDAALGELR